ncbi:hypothetical protein GCM10023192_14600 [Amycolatopsis samaneae]
MLPLALVAILFIAAGGPIIGIVFLVFAGLVLLFDAWVNRPDPAEARARQQRPRQPGPRQSDQRARQPDQRARQGGPRPRQAEPGRPQRAAPPWQRSDGPPVRRPR